MLEPVSRYQALRLAPTSIAPIITAPAGAVAGFHVPPGAIANGRWRRVLESRSVRLVVVARRRQGLMAAAANPKAIRSLADLTRNDVRFINRQEGSATRLLLDRLLAQTRTRPTSIRGYDHEEFTHLAVAATIAAGHADAGVGIEAAAARYGLTFLPLQPRPTISRCAALNWSVNRSAPCLLTCRALRCAGASGACPATMCVTPASACKRRRCLGRIERRAMRRTPVPSPPRADTCGKLPLVHARTRWESP
jgi:hypothetical protein